jgi:hypothetical protein
MFGEEMAKRVVGAIIHGRHPEADFKRAVVFAVDGITAGTRRNADGK